MWSPNIGYLIQQNNLRHKNSQKAWDGIKFNNQVLSQRVKLIYNFLQLLMLHPLQQQSL